MGIESIRNLTGLAISLPELPAFMEEDSFETTEGEQSSTDLVKRWNIEQKSTGLRSIGLNSSLILKNRSTMKQISQFGSTGQLDKLTNTLTNFKRDSDRRKSVQMTSL